MNLKRCLLILFCLVSMPGLVLAETINIDVRAENVAKLKVAIPAFGGSAELSSRAWDVAAKDIRMSGIFQLIDPQTYTAKPTIEAVTEADLGGWAAIGADYVVTGSAGRLGEKAVVNIYVTEVATGEVIIKQTYATAPGTVHQAVHVFMNRLLAETVNFKPIYTSKLACVRKAGGRKQLVTAWCDGTGLTAIGGLGDLVLSPAWSPSGGKLAYVSYLRDNPDLYLLGLDGSGARLISGRRGINSAPAFHPGGQLIAFTQTAVTKNASPEIVMTDLNGGNRRVLTDDYGIDTSPCFSPDGHLIAFCSDRGGNPQIYVLDVSGGGTRRLTFSGRYNTDPAFSPRGDQIAFSYLDPEAHVYRIALIRTDGSDLRVLPGTGRGDTQPSFSPDGRLVAFSCSDGDIYVCDLIGGEPVRVTDGRGVYSDPAWGPLLN